MQGCTAVMRACEYGHLQALEALSTKGLSLHGKLYVYSYIIYYTIIIIM